MAQRNNKQNQPQASGASDTEFGIESTLSKKARKKALREAKKKK